jgi:hypothetical protein
MSELCGKNFAPMAARNRDEEGWYMFRIAIALTALLWAVTADAGDEGIITIGEAAVAAKLIDPNSAHFTDVRVITRNGQQFVCGHVGAKTRKGQFDAKPFVFIANQKNVRHSAIIYDGRSISNDRFSEFAQPTAFTEICGSWGISREADHPPWKVALAMNRSRRPLGSSGPDGFAA